MLARGAAVREVIHAAAHGAEELFVAAFEGAEMWRVAQMPFADQGGAVACVFQKRGQGGLAGRQAECGAAFAAGFDRLIERAAQPVLPARRHQRKTGG